MEAQLQILIKEVQLLREQTKALKDENVEIRAQVFCIGVFLDHGF